MTPPFILHLYATLPNPYPTLYPSIYTPPLHIHTPPSTHPYTPHHYTSIPTLYPSIYTPPLHIHTPPIYIYMPWLVAYHTITFGVMWYVRAYHMTMYDFWPCSILFWPCGMLLQNYQKLQLGYLKVRNDNNHGIKRKPNVCAPWGHTPLVGSTAAPHSNFGVLWPAGHPIHGVWLQTTQWFDLS